MFLSDNNMNRQALLMISLLTISLLTMTVEANIRNVTGSLKLTATINHQPAFSTVSWQISNGSPEGSFHEQSIKVISRHSTTLELEPGDYRVVLSIGNKKEVRDVTIVESNQLSLIININR